jgi:hypothetical protein
MSASPSSSASGTAAPFEPPVPDAAKCLADWMEWEKGEQTPGRVLANLKTHGMRELLERLAATAQ